MGQHTSIRQRRTTGRRALSLPPRTQPNATGRSGVPRYLQRQPVATTTTSSPSASQPLAPYRTYTKRQLKLVLRDIIGLEWMRQSNGKKPIQLTAGLKSLIQLVTSLSDDDLTLLWYPVPKTGQAVFKLINHSLPGSVTAPVMQHLQKIKQQSIFHRKISVIPPKRLSPGKSGKAEAIAKQLKEQEKLFKLLVDTLTGKEPKDKDQTTKALKKTLKAFFKTEEGKKLKEKALEHLLSKKGIPFTIITGSGVLAAMIANNTNIPSTPEIDVSDSVSLKFEFEGTFQKPKSVKIVLKFTFGGAEKKEAKQKQPKILPLPNAVYTAIAKLDNKVIYKWLLYRAFWENEIAGPDEEEHKRKFYKYVRNNPGSMPDPQILAEHVARELMAHGMQNRIRELKGESFDTVLNFNMHQKQLWNEFYTLKGLKQHLNKIVQSLAPVVPFKALGIRNIMFLLGNHHPVSISIKQGKAVQ